MNADKLMASIRTTLHFLADDELRTAQEAFEHEEVRLTLDDAKEVHELLLGVRHDLEEVARIAYQVDYSKEERP